MTHADPAVPLEASTLPAAATDYLDNFRQKLWGKRDTWVWLSILWTLANALLVVVGAISAQYVVAAIAIGAVVICGAYFFQQPWARVGLVGLGVANAALAFGNHSTAEMGRSVVLLVVGLALLGDTRNKLAFRLEVDREDLQKAWNLYANNVIARRAVFYGVFGLLLCPIAPFALAMGIIGLQRVDPAHQPPIGRKGQAIAGIVLGILGSLELALIVGLALRR